MTLEGDELVAYQEGNKLAVSYSQLTLMAGAIFVSASFAIFGLSFTTLMEPSLISLLLMSVASCILYSMFLVYNERYGKMMHRIIFPMLQEIEENMKRQIHTKIKERDQERKELSAGGYTLTRIRFWNYFGFVALIILWIHRIILAGMF